ncbi:ATP-binding protein [Saccharococcus sp. Marseille-Q5394]|uniref:ATP-binding protein n=1 Tax=Saccharococcus sp. Marseille-Q5394 TaxID=2972778 RepID=UPI0021C9BE64|nr:ATP-binding protein [Saccharococcus sp. Marseille-Q5394]
MHELDTRKQEELQRAYVLSNEFVEKNYLSELAECNVATLPKEIQAFNTQNNVRLFKVNKLVYDKNESNLDKLVTVFNTIGNIDSSLIFLIDSDGDHTDLYVGIRTSAADQLANPAKEALEKSFAGNFPGSDIRSLRNSEIENVIERVFTSDLSSTEKVISSVSGIPSLKVEDKSKFVQGIEKLIDAMKGEKFSAVFVADSVSFQQISTIRRGYEKLYSQLVPFQTSELSFGANDSQTVTEGITKGFTHTVNESLTDTQNYTQGQSDTVTTGTNSSTSRSPGMGLTTGAAVAGMALMTVNPIAAIGVAVVGGTVGGLIGNKTKGESNSEAASTNSSTTTGTSSTKGNSESTSTTENESEAWTTGQSRNLQMKFENKSVTNLLEKIDEQLIRLKSSEDFGMWNCATYFLSENPQTSRVAASTYKAIMRGENSSVEHSFINTWDHQNKRNLLEVGNYLKKLHHPLIEYKTNESGLPFVSPGSLVNGKELAIQFGLPQKSISGIPVIETAEFGRNVMTYDMNDSRGDRIPIGQVFHMGRPEKTPVQLDLNSLAMHTFITGSTGTGKSNAVYKILDEVNRKGVKFLVIEPAKGEYKQIFGGRRDVHVFGTNPKFAPLFTINPFRFPDEIHVLEHIDRLVEIFNACWPMYAAMPAVLKDAIERTYESVGWDLDSSMHFDLQPIFPTLHDLLKILPEVINESAYSEELKSNYIGALVTRVKSLTNGLVGKLFADEETPNDVLFDENCLIDLSRIGSTETKSLLMGILFMRLQEHRMSESLGMNQKLKHITVLEEAHHLLRRTSSQQSQEGANLQGKSVEMITNAIAEMRTYGEGFIIADQSPNLLDFSAIRNTNTKIILRLPDGSDREEVGASASLNEDQINEIPKLKTGVAVIYQNNWLQPVLCEIEKHEKLQGYIHEYNESMLLNERKKNMGSLMRILLLGRISVEDQVDELLAETEGLKSWLSTIPMDRRLKQELLAELDRFQTTKKMKYWEQEEFHELSSVIWKLIDGEKFIGYAKEAKNFELYNEKMGQAVRRFVEIEQPELERVLTQSILYYHSIEKPGFKEFYFNWVEDSRKKAFWL